MKRNRSLQLEQVVKRYIDARMAALERQVERTGRPVSNAMGRVDELRELAQAFNVEPPNSLQA